MTKEVVWVVGGSASGKETFIRDILAGRHADVIKTLGWAGKKLAASDASLIYIGQYKGDPTPAKRDEILYEVPRLLTDADVALIKWQICDMHASRIEKLHDLLPNAHHKIVQLNVPYEELRKRLPNKPWWKKGRDVDEFLADREEKVANYVKEFYSDYPVTEIESSQIQN